MPKYFGDFGDRDSVLSNFQASPDGFPTDDQILWAGYFYESYEGDALVIYEVEEKLYEVHGGHCSCYGLEGQWEPEETSWEALAARPPSPYAADADALAALSALIAAHARTEETTA